MTTLRTALSNKLITFVLWPMESFMPFWVSLTTRLPLLARGTVRPGAADTSRTLAACRPPIGNTSGQNRS